MSPGMRMPEFHRPSSDVLVWEALPKFFHPTSVPRGTVIVDGLNAKSTIRTFASAWGDRASWEIAAVGPAINRAHATAHANSARGFVIEKPPSSAGTGDTTHLEAVRVGPSPVATGGCLAMERPERPPAS